MDDILTVLKLKVVTRSAQSEYKRLIKADLIVIDDIMLFPVEKNQAVNFFNFVNQIYESTFFVITTNKAPADWAKLLDAEVLATALLDRILFPCELINLTGKSYRLKNRKPIFDLKKYPLYLRHSCAFLLPFSVHSCCQKLCFPGCQNLCIVTYRLHLSTIRLERVPISWR